VGDAKRDFLWTTIEKAAAPRDHGETGFGDIAGPSGSASPPSAGDAPTVR
jgi:hypothetical protein